MKKVVLVILLLVCLVNAATISGLVYDANLEKIDKAIIELVGNSGTQLKVAQNGAYSFQVPPGQYVLTAKTAQNTETEFNQTITVSE